MIYQHPTYKLIAKAVAELDDVHVYMDTDLEPAEYDDDDEIFIDVYFSHIPIRKFYILTDNYAKIIDCIDECIDQNGYYQSIREVLEILKSELVREFRNIKIRKIIN